MLLLEYRNPTRLVVSLCGLVGAQFYSDPQAPDETSTVEDLMEGLPLNITTSPRTRLAVLHVCEPNLDGCGVGLASVIATTTRGLAGLREGLSRLRHFVVEKRALVRRDADGAVFRKQQMRKNVDEMRDIGEWMRAPCQTRGELSLAWSDRTRLYHREGRMMLHERLRFAEECHRTLELQEVRAEKQAKIDAEVLKAKQADEKAEAERTGMQLRRSMIIVQDSALRREIRVSRESGRHRRAVEFLHLRENMILHEWGFDPLNGRNPDPG